MPGPAASFQGKKHVLIVDDEHAIADTLAAILRNAGYHALAFYDPASALLHCRKICPDLVVSDVMMPVMNGIEMAIQIRQRCSGSKILLFSGMAASELLSKPIHPADLLVKLSVAAVNPQ